MKTIEEAEGKLYELLNTLGIQYRTKYHAKITTKDEADDLAKSLEGTICKSLLLKGPKDAYYLYIINANTTVNMKTLPKKIDVKTLRFAESDTYAQILKVNSKTCPTAFAITNDAEKTIKMVIIDLNIPKDKPVNFYAMREDGTTTILYDDMIKFIEHHNYPIKYVQE
jgi:Ala-tRNA(Pro) deacylase